MKNKFFSFIQKYLDLVILIVLCLLFGWASVLLGQDVGFDVLHYHLYNPFAFLTGHLGKDIMPASIHSFLNPLLDIPYYLLVKHFNNYPRFVAFVMGLPGGVLAFFVYKISWFLFARKGAVTEALIATGVGISGAMVIAQLGMTSNEVPLAAILCASFYVLLKFLFEKQTIKYCFWSAFLAGGAVGLKYTAAPFTIALTLVFLINLPWMKNRFRFFTYFALGGLAGFLATNGYFMVRLWIAYGNPFFPFLNGIFKSPFFDPVDFDEIRFYPRSQMQWLYYPFYWIHKSNGLVTEPRIYLADARFAAGYISVILIGVRLFWDAIFNRKNAVALREKLTLVVFCVVSYLLWLHYYSVIRYAVTLEVLCGILVIYALRCFFKKNWVVVIISLGLLGGIMFRTHYPSWRRGAYGKQVIAFSQMPKVKENALIVYYEEGVAFLSMFFPPDAQFIGGVKLPINDYPGLLMQMWAKSRNALPKGYYGYHFKEVSKQKIAAHDGPIYILTTPWPMMFHPLTLEPYGLDGPLAPCTDFNANINSYSDGWSLCEVQKLSDPQETAL